MARGRLGFHRHQPAGAGRRDDGQRATAAVSLPDDLLVPYSPPLEDAFIPSAERIAEAVRASIAP